MGASVTLNRNITAADCRKQHFTGIRQDSLLNETQIWVMGTMARSVSQLALDMDPQALAAAYAEVFGLHPDAVIII